MMIGLRAAGCFLIGLVFLPGIAFAQDMEPRAYSNAPVGMNFLVLSYGHSSGNVAVDSTLPIEDFRVVINTAFIAYARATDFFGHSGRIALVMPYAWGEAEGKISGQLVNARRSGLTDLRFKVSMMLLGAPALKSLAFVKYRPKTVIGVSLQVNAPVGQYDPTKQVNLGTNRWSFKPELGISRVLGKWTLELYGSVAFFTDNHQYLQTSTLSQSPIAAVQGHVAYSFRPRLWVSFDAIYFAGGQTQVNGIKRNDLQSNARYGLTFSVPLARQHSLKFLFSSGLVTRIGSDFNAVGVAYQFAWGGSR
jgi:Putative MetA-pathway of phenol degradation